MAQTDSLFEPDAYGAAYVLNRPPAEAEDAVIRASIAISLKRIADGLEEAARIGRSAAAKARIV